MVLEGGRGGAMVARRGRCAAALAALMVGGASPAAGRVAGAGQLMLDTAGVDGGWSCGDPGAVGKTFKIGFIYFSVIADVGWTYRHNEGRIFAQKKMSQCYPQTEIISEFTENGPIDVSSLDAYATRGFNLIITTSFTYHDQTLHAALKHPDTHFVHVSGFYMCSDNYPWPADVKAQMVPDGPLPDTCDNFITSVGKLYQARYLAGIVAGGTTKTNRIGYVASAPIPEVMRCINTYALGAQKAASSLGRPAVDVVVMWIYTFYHPDKEREATRRLIAVGSDVVAYHTDTRQAAIVAHQMGKMSVGSNGDVRRLVGESVLVSAYFNWGPMYKDMMNRSLSGIYAAGDYWYPYKDGVTTTSELSFQVEDPTAEIYVEERRRMVEDDWDPFMHPGGLKGACVFPMDSPVTSHPAAWCQDETHMENGQPPCPTGTGQCSSAGKTATFDIEGTSGGGSLSIFPGYVLMDWLLEGVYQLADVRLFGDVCPPGQMYTENADPVALTYSITCTSCPAGQYSDFTDLVTAASECTRCPAGETTGSKEGQTRCTPCDVGYYTPSTTGTPECMLCPTGRTNYIVGSHGASAAEACPVCQAGYENKTVAGAFNCVRIIPASGDEEFPVFMYPVFAGVFLLLVLGGALFYWKQTAAQRRIKKLFDNNRVAEECAENIASMQLDMLDFLFELENPNRIQAAFMSIVQSLKMYRDFMPASLLGGDEEDEGEDEGESKAGISGVGKTGGGQSASGAGIQTKSKMSNFQSRRSGATGTAATNRRTQVGYDRNKPGAGAAAISLTALALKKKKASFAVVNVVNYVAVTKELSQNSVLENHSHVLATLLQVLKACKGNPDGFQADRMYTSFSTVREQSSHRLLAAHAAIRMAAEAKKELLAPPSGMEVRVSGACASGDVLCGNAGCERLKKFTCIGEPCSFVHLIEQSNRVFDTEVLMDDSAFKASRQTVEARAIMQQVYKGKSRPLYQAIGMIQTSDQEWMYQLEEGEDKDKNKEFNKAMEKFFEGKHKDAIKQLQEDKDQTDMHAKMIDYIAKDLEAEQGGQKRAEKVRLVAA